MSIEKTDDKKADDNETEERPVVSTKPQSPAPPRWVPGTNDQSTFSPVHNDDYR